MPAIVNSLAVISEGARTGWNVDSATMAVELYHSIRKFEFLITFVVVKKALAYIQGLTLSLQEKDLDICTAYNEADNVKLSLSEVRQNIDVVHKAWYQTAMAIGKGIEAPEPFYSTALWKTKQPEQCTRGLSRSLLAKTHHRAFY